MMNVSMPGGLSDEQSEEPQERPLGSRVGAGERRDRAVRSDLWDRESRRLPRPTITASDGKQDVFQNSIAQKRHAALELLVIVGVVRLGIDDLAGHGRRTDAALQHQPKMQPPETR